MTATATAGVMIRRAIVLLALAGWSREARAQLTVSGSPAQLTVSSAVAGSAPSAVSNSSTTYSVSSAGIGHHGITVQLNSAMPAGVTLTVTLASAGNGTSVGPVTLTTTAQDAITGISKKITGATITYTLSATPAAGVVPVQTRRVTLTYVSTP